MLAAPLLVWPVAADRRRGQRRRDAATSCARSSSTASTLTFVTALKPGQAIGRRRDHRRRQRAALRLRHAAVRGADAGRPANAAGRAGWPSATRRSCRSSRSGVLADFLKNVTITSGAARRVADRLLGVAARGDRVRLPVRLADPAHRRAGGGVGADPPSLPRVAAALTRRRGRPARRRYSPVLTRWPAASSAAMAWPCCAAGIST